jgi:hypothetical protein
MNINPTKMGNGFLASNGAYNKTTRGVLGPQFEIGLGKLGLK